MSELHVETLHEAAEVLHSLLEVGANLSGEADRRKVLDLILREARRLARAEAGSLYVLKNQRLRFVAAQNDKVPLNQITQALLDKEMPVSGESLAGHVAATGRLMCIADTDTMTAEVPFRINRDFDAITGYHAHSILAVPLKDPDGECVGVLELFNRLGPKGEVGPFPRAESSGILSLASMAALAIHNMLLQERLKQAHLDTIIRLSVAVEFRDNATADHIRRISSTSGAITRHMGLNRHTIELVECASPMHDIGKIGIPDAILRKPEPLTEDERQIVQRHPVIGAEILGEPTNELMAAARDIALSHHERWDGTGYPNRLAGGQIPLLGRIVALADVFDALLCRRVYKEPYPLDMVLDTISRERGAHFDPQVADGFFAAMGDVCRLYDLKPVPAVVSPN